MVQYFFMVLWVVGSILHGGSIEQFPELCKKGCGLLDQSCMVDPLSCFLIQPVFLNCCNKGCGLLDRSYMVDPLSYFLI